MQFEVQVEGVVVGVVVVVVVGAVVVVVVGGVVVIVVVDDVVVVGFHGGPKPNLITRPGDV